MRHAQKERITACGTGGFLLAAVDYLNKHYSDSMTPDQRRSLSEGRTVHGVELVDATARLGTMNMYLHGVGQATGEPVIAVRDALAAEDKPVSMVLANPPFGRKSSITVIGDDGRAEREDISYSRDFWVTTTNKQLNFVQHIARALTIDGRAAVVVPDNVLFEGGAGETVRRRLLNEYDVHTLLRLPTGIFYAGGVKANVLFFDRKPPGTNKPKTEKLWVYDLRTGSHFTLKQRPMLAEHLEPFIEAYNADNRLARTESERFRAFSYDELMARDKLNLDITWLKDPSSSDIDDGVPPEIIAQEIVDDLTAALAEFSVVADALAARAAEVADATE